MNDELDIDVRSALRTAPAPLDTAAADRIWRDIEDALRSPASAGGAAIDLVDDGEVDRVTPQRTGHRAVVGWLAVAAAVVTVLVGVTAWRSGGDGGIGEVPTTTAITSPATVSVQYGEIPPLDDASIFYLPDPMPDGWHVVQAERSADLPMEEDWSESGPELMTEPPIADGVYRAFSVTLFNARADTFVQLRVVETGTSRIVQLNAGEEDVQVGGRDVVSMSPVDVGPSWTDDDVRWRWVQDGRLVQMLVGGDAEAAEVLVAAVRHVSVTAVLAAVEDGQAYARSLPILDDVTLGNGASLSLRGPGDDGVAVCADAVISTCAFVGHAPLPSRIDQAFGWAGSERGGFQYGWVRGPTDRLDLGAATVIEREDGSFVTDVAPDGTRVDPAPVLAGYPTAESELIGMPRLADLDPDTGELVPITPVVSGDAVAYGEVPPLDDASIFYLPDPMPDGWHVSQVVHGVDFPMDWVESGDPLDAEPPIPDGTFREFSAFLYRDDGRGFARLSVSETPHRLDDQAPQRASASMSTDGYSAAGLAPTANWGWVTDGRQMGLSIIGDEAAAEPLLDVIRSADGAAVAAAVAEGQAAARAMPVIASLELDGVTLSARGPGDRVLSVCADATISTCAFVSTHYGAQDLALGWAGSDIGAFSYGWAPTSLADRLDPGAVEIHPNEHGAFLTAISDVLIGSGGSGESLGLPRHDLVGMPRLAWVDSAGVISPITPGVSDVEGASPEAPSD